MRRNEHCSCVPVNFHEPIIGFSNQESKKVLYDIGRFKIESYRELFFSILCSSHFFRRTQLHTGHALQFVRPIWKGLCLN